MAANPEGNLRKIIFNQDAVTQSDGLEITVDRREESYVVSLNGRVNFESSPELRDRILPMLQGASPQDVVIDLAKVSYIDSSGIATLIEGLKIARNRQTRFCLEGLEGRLLDLFKVTGMLALFEGSGCKSVSSESKVS